LAVLLLKAGIAPIILSGVLLLVTLPASMALAGGQGICVRILPDGRGINEPCVVNRPSPKPIPPPKPPIRQQPNIRIKKGKPRVKPPDPAEGLLSRGLEHIRRRQWQQALEVFQRALRLRPGDPRLLQNLALARGMLANQKGNLLYRKRRYVKALKAYDQALQDLPGQRIILQNRANTLAKLDEIEAAQKTVSRLQREQSDLKNARARILGRMKVINQEMQGRGSTLGNTGLDLPKHDSKKGLIGSDDIFASQAEPDEPAARDVFAEPEKKAKAGSNRLDAVRQKARAKAAFSMAKHLMANGRFNQAVGFLKQALQADPDCTPCREELARLQSLVKDSARREKALDSIRRSETSPKARHPDWNRKANYLLDALEYGVGDWHASLKYLETGVAAEPGNRSMRDALEYLKGLHGGIKASEAARPGRVKPVDKTTVSLAGKALGQAVMGRHGAAAVQYRAASRNAGQGANLDNALAYAEQCQKDASRQDEDKTRGKTVRHLSYPEIEHIVFWSLGYAKMIEGDHDTALEYLKLAKQADPADSSTGKLMDLARGKNSDIAGLKTGEAQSSRAQDDKHQELLSKERAAVAFYALGYHKYFWEKDQKAALYYLRQAKKYLPDNPAIENLLRHATSTGG
jgi:tetratricopeptide (TPR) repeat protein